jgi:uncharacterized membrane protein YoaK (UPF0700 family)
VVSVERDDESTALSVQVAALLLAVVAGSVDSLAFLTLGEVFASVMTGNLVLLGIGLVRAEAQIVATAIALGGYVVGVLAASRLAWRARPVRVRTAAGLEGLLVAGLVIGWQLTDGPPDAANARDLLLVLAAAAMGVQSVLSSRLPGGPSTTYFTSTLTGVVEDLGRHRRLRLWSLARLVALVAGAALTAWLVSDAPRYAVGVPAVGLAAVLVLLDRGRGGSRSIIS